MKRRNFLRASGLFPFVAQSVAADFNIPVDKNTALPENFIPPGKEFFYKPEGAWAGDFIP